MDEREFEQGYANFHRRLNQVLRSKDVRAFKAHIAGHPAQAGKLSHCLGLSDELAEVEMIKAILVRSALKDMHPEALGWLKERGIAPPARAMGSSRSKGRKGSRGRRGGPHGGK